MSLICRKIPVLWALALACIPLPVFADRVESMLNDGWRFERSDNSANPGPGLNAPSESAIAFDDSSWEQVFLPHTPRIEQPEKSQNYFQGTCWYRRHIASDPAWSGKKVSLHFGGAMQVADAWVNGQHVLTHRGGYLPFSIDITSALAQPGGATVAVLLDNTDHPEIPPGKEHNALDFDYFGGLYRDAKLVVTDPLHVTDAVAANRVAAGGIFVRTKAASAESATIAAQADVLNEGAPASTASVHFTVIDPDGKTVAAADADLSGLNMGEERTVACDLIVPQPQLWHPDHPWLYILKAEVRRGQEVADTVSTRFGIRTVAFDDKRGFVLNGEPVTLRGANRHQDFPWLGNAEPDNATYRDLKLLKDAGFNFLRLAHYPQSEATMNACDELGLMVAVCTPGWQHFGDGLFADLAKQNIRDMIRWHRNHPSAIMWEVTLNETYGHDAFSTECAHIAHEEYPGDQMIASGDSGFPSAFDVPYAGWKGFYHRPAAKGFETTKRSFVREYGDYEFGGGGSSTRVSRGAGERALLLQAWNFIWTHNQNGGLPYLCGDCIWIGVDHFHGVPENSISRCGVLDDLRLPKFAYYFYQSQGAPRVPSLFIANDWTPRSSPDKVVVFSNCDEVELFCNGTSLGRRKPDDGSDSNYDAKNIFDGGNASHIEHPPFTFTPVNYEPGELKAVGYVDGMPVAQDVRNTPGTAAQLKLDVALQDRPLAADGSDAVFIRALIRDGKGNFVPTAKNAVTFHADGPAELVSPVTVPAVAGIATALIRSNGQTPGKVTVYATAGNLSPGQVEFQAQKP
jgi:beta-galactosidase